MNWIKIGILEIRRHEKNFLLGRGEQSIKKVQEQLREVQSIVQSEIVRKHTSLKTKTLLKMMMDKSVSYKNNFNRIISDSPKDDTRFHGAAKKRNALLSNLVTTARDLLATSNALVEIQTTTMAEIEDQTQSLMILSFLLYLSVAITVKMLVNRAILLPLRECADFAKSIAAGNLKESLMVMNAAGSAGSLAKSLNSMQTQLKHRIGFAEGILKGISAPFAVIDDHEKITYLNDAMLELLEIEGKKDLHIGQSWSYFFYNIKDKKSLMGEALKAFNPQKNFFMSIQTRKQNTRHTHIEINNLYDLDQNPIGAFCIITDLTPMKNEQKKLLNSNLALEAKTNELELLLENIDAQVWYVHNDVYMFANDARLKFMGKTFDEIKGKNINAFRIKNEIKTLEHYNDKVFKTKKIARFEEWFSDADKNRRLLSITKVPKLDTNNNVEFIITTAKDITEHKLLEEELKYKCFHDQLTDLYNRHYLIEEMNRLQKGRFFPLGIIFCDVDNMKLVNDTLGHEFGDKLLKTIAKIMKECFRKNDMVARYGGDEFVILQPKTSEEDVFNAVTRFRLSIKKYNEDNTELPIHISIGYIVSNNNNEPVKTILASADNLMYQEKTGKKQEAKGVFQLEGLLKAMEARDYITEAHGERMGSRISGICKNFKLSKATEHNFFLLACFHDIGKIGIPDKILFKPGPLNEMEWEKMKEHSKIGYRIAKSTPELSHISDWILHHHEKYDGTGYPSGFKGNNIPLACRIVAIVDAYDAMVSDRIYRKGMSHQDALEELKNESGKQFDPWLVDKFIPILKEESAPCWA